MANISLKAAFERFWTHVVAALNTKADTTTVEENYNSLKQYVDDNVGTIETALDDIIELQEELIGGEA